MFALKAERSLQRSSLLTDDGGWETLSHMTEICPDQAPPPIPHPPAPPTPAVISLHPREVFSKFAHSLAANEDRHK